MKTNDPQMTLISAPLGQGENAPNHLRKSAKSADLPSSLKPGEIEVHIEELILHGFDPRARWEIGDALERELRGLLAARGLPAAWQDNPARLDAGQVRLTNPATAGQQIAGALHPGGKSA